jgi:hypothetical protein
MSGFISRLPETLCTFTANDRLLGSYWLFNNRNWFTPFGESVPISWLVGSDLCAWHRSWTVSGNTEVTKRTIAGNSLHCGLNAPPMASQASVLGVASETHNML